MADHLPRFVLVTVFEGRANEVLHEKIFVIFQHFVEFCCGWEYFSLLKLYLKDIKLKHFTKHGSTFPFSLLTDRLYR